MNNFNFEVSWVGLLFSVGLRIIAAGFYAIVFWKAFGEVGIKNGLIKLRKQLLLTTAILFFINTAGMTLLLIRPFASPEVYRLCTDTLSVLNSVGFFIVSFLLFRIYTQSYTPERKAQHAKIEEMEMTTKTKVKMKSEK